MSLSLACLASPWKLHQVQQFWFTTGNSLSVHRGAGYTILHSRWYSLLFGGEKNLTMKRILSCERCFYQDFSFQFKNLSAFLLFLIEETAKEITRESKTGQETAEEITRECKTGLKNSTTLFQVLKMFWEGLETDHRSLFSYLYFLRHINTYTEQRPLCGLVNIEILIWNISTREEEVQLYPLLRITVIILEMWNVF